MKEKERLAEYVVREYERRREDRRGLETKWLLNLNFMLGNQNAGIVAGGDVVTDEKRFPWEQNEVYNHIAPIIENRLSKFARVNSTVNVRPASGSDNDVQVAKLSGKLIEATQLDNDFVAVQSTANYWSEVTGTSFYKVQWTEGGVGIEAIPPYEIYPDTLNASGLDELGSLIHARAYPVYAVRERYGNAVKETKVSVLGAENTGLGRRRVFSEPKEGHCIVLEYYERPTKEFPQGRLLIVAGDTLVYEGTLPFQNGKDGTRTFPFVRQVAFSDPASFFGISLIERLIPIQRAYNAVKNRKHELMNRQTAGVMAVEDGSVDVDLLESEGLAPGSILVYRQGSVPPSPLSVGGVPADLRDEEDRLYNEFYSVAGSSNLFNSASILQSNVSGYALSLLVEQDYAKLSVTTESIRRAVKEIAKQILRLYHAHGKGERIFKVSGENGELEVMRFLSSDLNSDDVVMEADSEMTETPATRRNMVLELLKLGLLTDENGAMSARNKAKVLEMLGFGNWESARNTEEIHMNKAKMEQEKMLKGSAVEADENDDHALHIQEHTLCLASNYGNLKESAKKALEEHIRSHKVLNRLKTESEKMA